MMILWGTFRKGRQPIIGPTESPMYNLYVCLLCIERRDSLQAMAIRYDNHRAWPWQPRQPRISLDTIDGRPRHLLQGKALTRLSVLHKSICRSHLPSLSSCILN